MPSSRRESRQPPQCFKSEVANFGNENSENTPTVHVPLIIPIFTPRDIEEENTIKMQKLKSKKRKFTAVEEYKESDLNSERVQKSVISRENNNMQNYRMFEEFFIIGPDENLLKNYSGTEILQTENLMKYPNLAENSDWYFGLI